MQHSPVVNRFNKTGAPSSLWTSSAAPMILPVSLTAANYANDANRRSNHSADAIAITGANPIARAATSVT